MSYQLSKTPLLSEEQIQQRVKEIAVEIVRDMSGDGEGLVVIGLLRGCFMFMADLVREIGKVGGVVDEVDFIVASSYGAGTESSGNVKIERDLRSDIAGRKVLIIDDILDTGNTLTRVSELLKLRSPSVLKTCALLDKPSRREKVIEADFTGFSIKDHFVVGYGLDIDQKYRELSYIGLIEIDNE